MGIWLMAGIFDRAVGLGLLRNTQSAPCIPAAGRSGLLYPVDRGLWGLLKRFPNAPYLQRFVARPGEGFGRRLQQCRPEDWPRLYVWPDSWGLQPLVGPGSGCCLRQPRCADWLYRQILRPFASSEILRAYPHLAFLKPAGVPVVRGFWLRVARCRFRLPCTGPAPVSSALRFRHLQSCRSTQALFYKTYRICNPGPFRIALKRFRGICVPEK